MITNNYYDKFYEEKDFEYNQNLFWEIDYFVEASKAPKNSSVLDVGCGLGATTYALSQYFPNVIGLDISQKAVELAKNRFPELIFQHNDFSNLRDQKFDTIYLRQISFLGVKDLNSIKELFEKLIHLLNDNGFIFITHQSDNLNGERSGWYLHSQEVFKSFLNIFPGKSLVIYENNHIYSIFSKNLELNNIQLPFKTSHFEKAYAYNCLYGNKDLAKNLLTILHKFNYEPAIKYYWDNFNELYK